MKLILFFQYAQKFYTDLKYVKRIEKFILVLEIMAFELVAGI